MAAGNGSWQSREEISCVQVCCECQWPCYL